jgi:hypothetical protein
VARRYFWAGKPGGTWAGKPGGNCAGEGAGAGKRWDKGSVKRDDGRRTKDEGGSRGKGRNSHYEGVILCGMALTHKGGWGKVRFYVFVC